MAGSVCVRARACMCVSVYAMPYMAVEQWVSERNVNEKEVVVVACRESYLFNNVKSISLRRSIALLEHYMFFGAKVLFPIWLFVWYRVQRILCTMLCVYRIDAVFCCSVPYTRCRITLFVSPAKPYDILLFPFVTLLP